MKKTIATALALGCIAANVHANTNRVLFLDNRNPEPYVNIPRSASLEPASNVTVEAWIKPFKMPSGELVYNVVTKRINEHTPPYNSYIMGGGKNSATNWYGAVWSTSGAYHAEATNNIGWSNWTHVAMSYNGLQTLFYINGQLVASNNGTGSLVYSSLSLRIGKAKIPQFDDGFYGLIDEVRVWNRTLTPAEIQNGLSHELRGDEFGLVGYWNFNDGTAGDSSPQNNDGSFVDGATTIYDEVPWSGPFSITDIRVSALDIEWNSMTGKSYQVQYSDALIQPAWSNLGSVYLGTGSNMYHMDVIRFLPERFYRVIEE